MSSVEIITLFITILCLVSFCAVFTILFRHYFLSNIESVSSGKEDIDLIDNAIVLEKEKKKNSKKFFKVLGKVFSYIILGIVLIVFGISLYSKIRGNTIVFGNSTLVVIASGSMSEKNNDYVKNNPSLNNQFDTYDIIGITRYSSQDQVKLYDVIAYKNKKDVTIVHRIVEIKKDSEGNDVYLTQGDSNLASDNSNASQYSGYLTFDRIIGHYNELRVKGLGIFVIFLQSPAGIVTICSVVYCLLMFDYFSSKYKKAIIERTNLLIKLIDYDLSTSVSDSKLVSKYHETLSYQDKIYTFEDGKFNSREELSQKDDRGKNKMVFSKRENGKLTITITDTQTGEEKIFPDCSTEDEKDPLRLLEK